MEKIIMLFRQNNYKILFVDEFWINYICSICENKNKNIKKTLKKRYDAKQYKSGDISDIDL